MIMPAYPAGTYRLCVQAAVQIGVGAIDLYYILYRSLLFSSEFYIYRHTLCHLRVLSAETQAADRLHLHAMDDGLSPFSPKKSRPTSGSY